MKISSMKPLMSTEDLKDYNYSIAAITTESVMVMADLFQFPPSEDDIIDFIKKVEEDPDMVQYGELTVGLGDQEFTEWVRSIVSDRFDEVTMENDKRLN
ncbi:hypothetical protein EVB32_153 [Rhizobium phage RHph_TM39]|nr:hypothetical protein EVB95_152 [Rhizobium phage RHph_TM2_3B]QIG72349.1 hypothetical protein EVB96_153 [Rhizobium phage RHph_TM3_3_6]QIG77141.1 hypothetical protein EVB32_153 [Rhizobium phage RHph_TM39]